MGRPADGSNMLIIQCMWVTCLGYEARCESDDIYHLLIKGVHVLLPIGVGVCGDKFSIEGELKRPRWRNGAREISYGQELELTRSEFHPNVGAD